jgi:acyl transferase domain-containing protein
MPQARGFDVIRSVAESTPPRPLAPAVARLRREALALAAHERLVQAAYSYRIVPLEGPADDVLCADGETLAAPWLLPESGELTAVACGVCTIGRALEDRVQALFAERRASLAVALDSLGNELLSAVSRRAQDRMLADAKKRGLSMAGELRAGDPGLAIESQSVVLRLAQAESIGVTLSRGQMMHPVKSTSMVLGVGLELPAAKWSRCDACASRARCAVPRAAAAAA